MADLTVRDRPTGRLNSSARIRGAVIGLVTNNKDPDNRGRVKVKFPWLDDRIESHWARVKVFYAGPGRGGYIIPEVGDEVLLMFENGNPAAPYVVGSLWNGVDKIPGPGNPDGKNDTKWWQSRSGHKLVFSDKDGAEKVTLVNNNGKLKIEIDVAADTITFLATTGDIFFKAPAGPINISSKTMKINASKSTTVKVGDGHNEVAKDRTETVGVEDSATAKDLWQVGTKTLTVSFGSGKFEAGSGTMVVEKSSMQTMGSCEYEGHTVHRNTGPETLTAGMLEVNAKQFQLVLEQAATITTGMHQVKSDADASIHSTAVLTVMGGLINYSGGSNITTQASLVTLC